MSILITSDRYEGLDPQITVYASADQCRLAKEGE
jgi:hypothetical protein